MLPRLVLELLSSNNPPALASQSTGITGVSHGARVRPSLKKKKERKKRARVPTPARDSRAWPRGEVKLQCPTFAHPPPSALPDPSPTAHSVTPCGHNASSCHKQPTPTSLKACGHVLPIELLVCALEPAQGRLVPAVQPVVEIDDGIIVLNVLVQCVLQIPGHNTEDSVMKITCSLLKPNVLSL